MALLTETEARRNEGREEDTNRLAKLGETRKGPNRVATGIVRGGLLLDGPSEESF